jgi:hypothetical protein
MAFSNTTMQNQDSLISHTSADGILTVKVKGRVPFDSLTKYVAQHREAWVQHPCILYDALELDLSGVTADDVLQLPESTRETIELRAGGRSAILVKKEFEVIAKYLVVGYESIDSPVELRTFLHEEDALAWLRAI